MKSIPLVCGGLADGGKLRSEVARLTVLGEIEFALPAASGRTARTARTVNQGVRVARVTQVRHAGKTREITDSSKQT